MKPRRGQGSSSPATTSLCSSLHFSILTTRRYDFDFVHYLYDLFRILGGWFFICEAQLVDLERKAFLLSNGFGKCCNRLLVIYF